MTMLSICCLFLAAAGGNLPSPLRMRRELSAGVSWDGVETELESAHSEAQRLHSFRKWRLTPIRLIVLGRSQPKGSDERAGRSR